jgi:hypothetical protein
MRFTEPACSRTMCRGTRPANTGRFKGEEPVPDRIEQGRMIQAPARGCGAEKDKQEAGRAGRSEKS